MLHVTNGDSVVTSFKDGGIPGMYLPWRDVLHDGAVPHRETLEAMSDVRAGEIARLGRLGDYDALRASFAERDRTLTAFRDHEEVVLWFEHDLYDQLQLLQILAWFAQQDLSRVRLTMIQIGSHPDVTPFYGLGQLTGEQLSRLMPERSAVTARQLEIGAAGWAAFCSEYPWNLARFAREHHPEMPFLEAALVRFLEEYPSPDDSLSRSERQLLKAAVAGAKTRREFYDATSPMEPWPWGDNSVYLRLDGLADAREPALDRRGDVYAINAYGRRLLAADQTAVRARAIDTWLGGVHLTRYH